MSRIQRLSSNPSSVTGSDSTFDVGSGEDGLSETATTPKASQTKPFNDGLVLDLKGSPSKSEPPTLARSVAAESKMQADVRSAELKSQLSSSYQIEPTSLEIPNLTSGSNHREAIKVPGRVDYPNLTDANEKAVYQHNQTDLEFDAGKKEVSIESVETFSTSGPKKLL